MENSGEEIAYPTVGQICEINRRMIVEKEFGGLFVEPNNLLNLSALEYILEAIQFSMYGFTIYPTLKEKAAAISHHIISRHVFHDGNKRTGTHIAWEFLRANGKEVFLDESIVELTVAIAKSEVSHEALLQWLHEHQVT
ncbi:MAG: type II toxin-antitoxin system death-on-curing family toxin [Promethearchaeota archaeon]